MKIECFVDIDPMMYDKRDSTSAALAYDTQLVCNFQCNSKIPRKAKTNSTDRCFPPVKTQEEMKEQRKGNSVDSSLLYQTNLANPNSTDRSTPHNSKQSTIDKKTDRGYV